MSRPSLAWGAIAGAVYVAVAALTFHSRVVPVRPLYEGVAPPPPYRWVKPPKTAATTERPQSGKGVIQLTSTGAEAGSAATGDGQAFLVVPEGAFAPRAGETEVSVTIVPRDPAPYGPAPSGLRVDGNAYEITAVYGTSKAPAVLAKPVQVVLRYPVDATTLLLWTGKTWQQLTSTPTPASLQIFADASAMGVFGIGAPPQGGPGVPWWIFVAIGLFLAMAAVLGTAALRDRRRPPTRAERRRKGRSGPQRRRR